MSERRRPNLVVAYSRLAVVELVRLPAFVAPTLAFPPLLFLFFGAPRAKGADAAWAISASFAAFAVLGVLLFQFGVGIADERDSPWERYVRTLRAPPWVRFAGRITAALVFSVASLAPLAVVAAMTTDVSPSLGAFGSVLVAVLVGSVPFGLFGIAMGYWVHPKGALAVTNLIYLPLAYLGGCSKARRRFPMPCRAGRHGCRLAPGTRSCRTPLSPARSSTPGSVSPPGLQCSSAPHGSATAATRAATTADGCDEAPVESAPSRQGQTAITCTSSLPSPVIARSNVTTRAPCRRAMPSR